MIATSHAKASGLTAGELLEMRLRSLIDLLVARGVKIGLAERAVAMRLAAELCARGMAGLNPDHLVLYFRPVLAKSLSDMATFDEVYTSVFSTRTAKESRSGFIDHFRRYRRAYVAGILLFGLTLYVFAPAADRPMAPSTDAPKVTQLDKDASPDKRPKEGSQETGPARKMAPDRAAPKARWDVAILLGFCVIVTTFLLWPWIRANLHEMRQAYLRSRQTGVPPNLSELTTGDRQTLRRPLLALATQFFLRGFTSARRFIDVERTVRFTAIRAGQFSPVFAKRVMAPEFLCLITKYSIKDSEAARITDLVAEMTRFGLRTELYYLQHDSNLASKGDLGPYYTLKELGLRHPLHVLLYFGPGAPLISPPNNRLWEWASDVSQWPARAAFVPTSSLYSSDVEVHLARLFNFRVFPSVPEGLLEFAMSIWQDSGLRRSPVHQVRRVWSWDRRPRRWLSDAPIGDKEWISLKYELYEFLAIGGRNVEAAQFAFRWLAACAVYPEVRWDLADYFGLYLERLGAGKGTNTASDQEDQGAKLARLPWFREGRMPNWLRLRLIAEMTEEQRGRVAGLLQELLSQAENRRLQRRGSLMLPIATLAPADAPASARRDYVYLEFLSNAEPMDVKAPKQLVDRLEPRAVDESRHASWTRAAITGTIVFFFGTVLLGPLLAAILEVPNGDLGTIITADSHLYIFVPLFGLLLLCASIGPLLQLIELAATRNKRRALLLVALIGLLGSTLVSSLGIGVPKFSDVTISTAGGRECADENEKCHGSRVWKSLTSARAAAKDRLYMSKFARACDPDPLLEEPITYNYRRFCFASGDMMATSECCRAQQDLAREFVSIRAEVAPSVANRIQELLLPSVFFFFFCLPALALALGWNRHHHRLSFPQSAQIVVRFALSGTFIFAIAPVFFISHSISMSLLFGSYAFAWSEWARWTFVASIVCLICSGVFFWLHTKFADSEGIGIIGSIYISAVGVFMLQSLDTLRDYSLAFVGIGISLERVLYVTLIVLIGGLLVAIAQRYRLLS